jgi:hypothetical protein
MKNRSIVVFLLSITLLLPTAALAQNPTTIPGIDQVGKKPKVMVLGTFHFDNPGLDYVKTSVPDILTAQHQKELRELLDKIKAFKPTKIAIEAEPQSSERINARYSRYVAGQDTLRRSETDQIGFRLAKELGHKAVYCVDVKQDMDFGAVMQTAQAVGQTDFLRRFQQATGFIQTQLNTMAKLPLLEQFRSHNNLLDGEHMHGFYLLMATVGKDTNYTGAKVIAGWYERNLKIAVNVMRIIESPEDRILVLFGAGHLPLLYHYFKFSPDVDVVNVEDYLKPNGVKKGK